MKIVCFNGPPRSGKDTLAAMLADHCDSQGVSVPILQRSLSEPLRVIAYGMAGYEGKRLDGPDYEEFKVTLFPNLGVTGRQLMIDASEKFLKPVYGEQVMGKLLLNQLTGPYTVKDKLVLIRDSGFQCEFEPLREAVGDENIIVIQVIREGTTFEGDSREWVTHPNGKTYMIYNESLDDLKIEAGRIYGRLVNQLGWVL